MWSDRDLEPGTSGSCVRRAPDRATRPGRKNKWYLVGLKNRSVRCVACKNDNSVNLRFLIMSFDPYFASVSCLKRNSATVRSILMMLGRIIDVGCFGLDGPLR